MKKMLNTLFVTTDGAYIRKRRDTAVVEIDNKQSLQLPLLSLSNIYCFGRVNMSPSFMHKCSEMGIGISFFSMYGRFMARVQGPKSGNVLLRRNQYRWADDPVRYAGISRFIIGAKISNCRSVLQRVLRNNKDCNGYDDLRNAVSQLLSSLRSVRDSTDIDSIRGIEGESAANYFNVFDHLIMQQKESFSFTCRNRRPPKDPVNAMMSFVYSIMLQDCVSALEGVGLDPYVGFLHRDRPGRQSLGLDMQEEFRAMLGDRLVLSLINRQQTRIKDFKIAENGTVLMGDELKKLILSEYHKRKQDEVHHPAIREKVKVGMLFHAQALLLSRHIRGDMDYYPAFVWR